MQTQPWNCVNQSRNWLVIRDGIQLSLESVFVDSLLLTADYTELGIITLIQQCDSIHFSLANRFESIFPSLTGTASRGWRICCSVDWQLQQRWKDWDWQFHIFERESCGWLLCWFDNTVKERECFMFHLTLPSLLKWSLVSDPTNRQIHSHTTDKIAAH